MALSTTTYTYDAVRLPQVDLTVVVDDVTGQTRYTAVVWLLELDPIRTTTSEERVAGISSISPPTVTSQIPQEVINLALRACGSAYHNTAGLELTPDIYASLSYTVPAAVAGALRLAGADV